MDDDLLYQEWSLLSVDPDVNFILEKNQRIDNYWSGIFSLKVQADQRYPTISYVVKAALSLTHGSGSVERGFSESAQILTENRSSMSENMLNAILTVREGLKRFDMKPHLVSIDAELFKLARNAHKEYDLFQSEEKKKEEEKKNKLEVEITRKNKEEKILQKIKDQVDSIANLEKDLEGQTQLWKAAKKEADSMQEVLTKTTDNCKMIDYPNMLKHFITALNDLRNKDAHLAFSKSRKSVKKN